MTESELSDNIVQVAHLFGWRVLLVRPARTAHGWRTPFGADGVGWPDLTIVRSDRIIFAELKANKGKLTEEQRIWIDALSNVGETYVWRPEQWMNGEIESVLRHA